MSISTWNGQNRQMARAQSAYDRRLPDDYYELPEDNETAEDPDESGKIWEVEA